GRDLPRRNGERKIPRGDRGDHTDGLTRDFHVDAGAHRVSLFAVHTNGFTGEKLEDVASARRLSDTVGQWFALLARQHPPQLVLARKNLGAGAIENVEAFLRRAAR